MAFPTTPAAPVRSAVEADNRITTRLNKSGTEATNLIVGNSRNGTDSGNEAGGFGLELEFGMVDALEAVYGSTVTIYDDGGAVVSNHSIRDLWTTSALTMKASAQVVAGVDFPSEDAPRRAIVQVWTSRKRAITGQFWVGNLPANQVMLNGVQTTQAVPLEIMVGDLGVEIPISIQIFPSLNDEVGRQHGSDTSSLQANMIKPYGGASHVNVLHGIVQKFTNAAVSDVTTITHTPTSDGETVQFVFLFVSKLGSSDVVRCYAYVRFVICETTGGGTTTTTTGGTTLICPPCLEVPIITPPPGIPDDGPGVIEEDTVGRHVRVKLDRNGDLGEGTDPAQVDLKILAYEGGTADIGSTPVPTIVQLGAEQTLSIPITEGITTKVYLPVAIEDAHLVVVRPETVAGKGGAVPYRLATTNVGAPDVPTVSGVVYNFSIDRLTFNLDSLGFSGETVTAHVKPLTGKIGNPGASHQTNADLTVDTGEAEGSLGFTTIGSGKVFDTAFTDDPEAVAVSFSNSFGSTTVILIRETDAIYAAGVKRRPAISSVSLISGFLTRDTIQLTVDDAGANPGNLTVHYRIVEAVLGAETAQMPTVADVGLSTISATLGVKTTPFSTAAHNNIRGRYMIWVEGDQGFSDMVQVDNLVGTGTLPA